MIISHRYKFAFFRSPKTGTTTANFMLRLLKDFDEKIDICSGADTSEFPAINFIDNAEYVKKKNERIHRRNDGLPVDENFFGGAHMTPEDAVNAELITIEQLREYDVYSFLREPYSRHLSAVNHVLARHVTPDRVFRLFEDILPEMSVHPKDRKRLGVITRPQVEYFFVGDEQVTTPLDFRQYIPELKALLKAANCVEVANIPRLNGRARWKEQYEESEFWTPEYRERFAIEYKKDIEFYNQTYNI